MRNTKTIDDKTLIDDIKYALNQSKFDAYYCQLLEESLDALVKKYKHYKDIALHGRDSDDAKNLTMCRNDPRDFIKIDLDYGMS